MTVNLVSGTNFIRLETTAAAEFAMIDWIEIVGTSPTEAACSGAVGSRVANSTTVPVVDAAPVIFPNPATGTSTLKLTVVTQQRLQVSLYAADGRLVQQVTNRVFAPGVHYVPVALKGIRTGVYFIGVNNGKDKQAIQPLVVQ